MVDKNQDLDENVTRTFIVDKRLGKGAYGIVWKVKRKTSNENFALKKVFDAFRNQVDAQRTYREVCFLKDLQGHPNIISLVGTMKSQNNIDFYLIFEYMDSDLDKLIRKKLLQESHKCFILYQILNGLAYIHSAGVIHRDLKPSNIFINSKCMLKIGDFGMARSLSMLPTDTSNEKLTDYVATRWYRAPEILISSPNYGFPSDMWSFACIVGEIFLEKPLFRGNSSLNQLDLIIEGLPEAERTDIEEYSKEHSRSFVLKFMSPDDHKNILTLLAPIIPVHAKDLLAITMKFHPKKRPTAFELLGHKYISEYKNSLPEQMLNIYLVPKLKEKKLSTDEYRNVLIKGLNDKNVGCNRVHPSKIDIRETLEATQNCQESTETDISNFSKDTSLPDEQRSTSKLESDVISVLQPKNEPQSKEASANSIKPINLQRGAHSQKLKNVFQKVITIMGLRGS